MRSKNQAVGLAEAFIIGEDFMEELKVALILGDNIFYGFRNCSSLLQKNNDPEGGIIYAYHVSSRTIWCG